MLVIVGRFVLGVTAFACIVSILAVCMAIIKKWYD